MNAALPTMLLAGLLTALPALSAPPRAKPVSIPFDLEEGNIVVQVELTPGRPLPFIFDSGLSDGNIVSADAAQTLHLKITGEVNLHDASGTPNAAKLTTIPSVRVGGAVLRDQTYAIIDIPDEVTERDEGEAPIAGFLGAPLMQDAVVCVDYQKKTMQRWKRADFDGSTLTAVPMRLQHGLPVIRVGIDGRFATLAVDSGNNGGVQLFPSFADESLLRSRYPDMKIREGMSGSGQRVLIVSGEADVVEVAPGVALHKVPLSSMAQSFDPEWEIDGLVGSEFLSRLDPCLDRDGQRLLWDARKTARN
ncbi:aspartyl protease [Panacagrimonas perspica]|uniref:Aspartyl protease n=1 Tax=Panacagrimonas perspica TaxID=381431 RepID=A0A4R7PDW5_9GAMM|nr:aspartyl protease family protein [Panacagrimonas perspica]TDU31952.1 aspartyl protease [Panacagrimonas perspica]THD04266.1 hypothetical protein B1810_06445 [Panacagrimonas perspica]